MFSRIPQYRIRRNKIIYMYRSVSSSNLSHLVVMIEIVVFSRRTRKLWSLLLEVSPIVTFDWLEIFCLFYFWDVINWLLFQTRLSRMWKPLSLWKTLSHSMLAYWGLSFIKKRILMVIFELRLVLYNLRSSIIVLTRRNKSAYWTSTLLLY